MILKNESDGILRAFYKVYNALGYGFLEKVYERALCLELNKNGLYATAQFPIAVYYEQIKVGQYFADILINQSIIIEIKSAEGIAVEHTAQLMNYMKATEIELGFILNFGPKPTFSRKVFENHLKKSVPIR